MTSAVRRRIRLGELSPKAGKSLLDQAFRDLDSFVAAEKLELYPMSEQVLAMSVQCLRRCAVLGVALRSHGAIHIATVFAAGQSEPMPFITADRHQLHAANAVGLDGRFI